MSAEKDRGLYVRVGDLEAQVGKMAEKLGMSEDVLAPQERTGLDKNPGMAPGPNISSDAGMPDVRNVVKLGEDRDLTEADLRDSTGASASRFAPQPQDITRTGAEALQPKVEQQDEKAKAEQKMAETKVERDPDAVKAEKAAAEDRKVDAAAERAAAKAQEKHAPVKDAKHK